MQKRVQQLGLLGVLPCAAGARDLSYSCGGLWGSKFSEGEGVNLSLLREGRPAKEMPLPSPASRSGCCSSGLQLTCLLCILQSTREQQRGETHKPRTSVSWQQPYLLQALGLTRLREGLSSAGKHSAGVACCNNLYPSQRGCKSGKSQKC